MGSRSGHVSYSYQWISNDGSSDTDIEDATGSSYTLVAADEGNTIKVRVSFTDDRGNDETLTSSATAAVAAQAEPVSFITVEVTGSGSPTMGVLTDIEGASPATFNRRSGQDHQGAGVLHDDAGNDETRTSYPTRVVNLLFGYITGTVTEDTSDPNNVITNFTFTWVDAHVCSTDYNAYLHIVGDAGEVVHLGSATSSGAGITKGLAAVRDNLYWYRVELYCGTDIAGRWVSEGLHSLVRKPAPSRHLLFGASTERAERRPWHIESQFREILVQLQRPGRRQRRHPDNHHRNP